MKIFYLATVATLLAIPYVAHGHMPKVKNNNAAVQQIIDFRNRYVEAEENKDIAYLNKIFAANFFVLNPQGKLLDRSQQLENIKKADREFKVLNPRETHVRFYDKGNMAILTELVNVVGEDTGRHFGGEFRFVRVFLKRSGNWQVVSAVGVPLSPQSTGTK